MSKRQQDEFLSAASQLAEQLSVLDDQLSVTELGALLRDAGTDPDALITRFRAAVKDMESSVWAKGKTPPLYLRRLAAQTAASGALPTERAAALVKVKEWLQRFRKDIAATFDPVELEVLRAYRKDGDLSSNDITLLDELEQKLKANVAARRRYD